VLLVNPMLSRVFGGSGRYVPLGLEYMKGRLCGEGFSAEIYNLDFPGPGESRTRPPRDLVAGFIQRKDYEGLFRQLRKPLEDRGSIWWTDFADTLKKVSPAIVGIGMNTPQYHAGMTAARIVREVLPGAKLVAGGIHPTVMAGDVLAGEVFDVAAAGEGEKTVVRLARHFIRGEGDLESIPGIRFKRGKETVWTGPVDQLDDLDTLDFPSRECLAGAGDRVPTVEYSASIITKRGCPFRCSYCAPSALWPRSGTRYRSAENVAEEIDYLKRRFELAYLYIYDDTFNIKKSKVMKFCDTLASRRTGLNWHCYVRADRLDDEQAGEMKRAGCDSVYIGCESGSQDLLDRMNKNLEVDDLRRAVEISRRHGFRVVCSFIAGHPDETPASLAASENLARELSPDKTVVFFMVPFPGSEMYVSLKEKGLIRTFDWFLFNMSNPSLIERGNVSDKEIIDFADRVQEELSPETSGHGIEKLKPAFILKKLRSVRSMGRLLHLARRFLETATGRDHY